MKHHTVLLSRLIAEATLSQRMLAWEHLSRAEREAVIDEALRRAFAEEKQDE